MRVPRLTLTLLAALLIGCDRRQAASPATQPAHKTIASTVPAVTDLIVGMGLGDRLVAVSTYDKDRPDVGNRPKAGDYDTVDWELLATLRPDTLVTFIAPDRQSAGYRAQADRLHITLMNVPMDHLDQLDPAIDALGNALGEPERAAAAKRHIDDGFAAVERRVHGLPPVSALIVIGAEATGVAGPGTYLDDLLRKAGGTNAAESMGRLWPEVDAETMASLHASVVIQLLPDATPQVRAAAAAVWAHRPPVRVCPIYESYAQQPGYHLPELADLFARCLHPTPSH